MAPSVSIHHLVLLPSVMASCDAPNFPPLHLSRIPHNNQLGCELLAAPIFTVSRVERDHSRRSILRTTTPITDLSKVTSHSASFSSPYSDRAAILQILQDLSPWLHPELVSQYQALSPLLRDQAWQEQLTFLLRLVMSLVLSSSLAIPSIPAR